MKLFYTGPVVNTEMLVVMVEKHGIAATQEFEDPSLPDDGDLNPEGVGARGGLRSGPPAVLRGPGG